MKIQRRQLRMFQTLLSLAHWTQSNGIVPACKNDIPQQEDAGWWYVLAGDIQCDELDGLCTWDLIETY